MDDYESSVEELPKEETEEEFQKAREYNESLLSTSVTLTDPFDPNALENAGKEPYASLLNVRGDGIMGYVEIPQIGVYLPIYHGTAAKTLEKGIGHLENTSLPVGGKSSHSVLTGHTGLSGEKMFTDLTELKKGDIFYLHVLGELLCYKVAQISIVEPEDTGLLKIKHGEDYVTLLTCYPYGINSHRLLVRGSRISYEEAVQQQKAMRRPYESQWNEEYLKGVAVCIAVYVPITLAILWFLKRKRHS